MPHRHVGKTVSELAGTFGAGFAANLADLEPGKWHGPVLSGFGLHLVFIDKVAPGRPLTLEEASRDVRRDWDNEQRVKAIDTLYEELGKDYMIRVEPMAARSEEA